MDNQTFEDIEAYGRERWLDENGIVSGYQVLEGNAADTGCFLPTIKQHQSYFGRAPDLATADRGFFSAKNEREAKELGVKPTLARLQREHKGCVKRRKSWPVVLEDAQFWPCG